VLRLEAQAERFLELARRCRDADSGNRMRKLDATTAHSPISATRVCAMRRACSVISPSR
jgi:hypothetical protein